MPCEHKFIEDLQLDYVNWKPKTLFIGTFNPSWLECPNNNADWFYGRTQRNDFWCILPRIHNEASLIAGNREIWIDFCRRNDIAITDILENLLDANQNDNDHREVICKFKDDKLVNFDVIINNIPKILEKHKSIKQICITRQHLPDFWKECFSDLFEYLNLNPQITLKYLRSPSRGARRGIVGNFCEFISNRWSEQEYSIRP
ncbi:hypothetical protein BC749_10742 [Flavobacterium araucananum]|uniref:Uncharacterized protein n=1 Tax=Flavobacterium araucananum TaxID=946678 RepID=A0A227NMV5_9FLAO|nr:hypothetical protein [Flavobacterium araucananum]OXE98667.1 hypothetical protein B0A64_22495 [Flavobacterium araucananum]PWJ97246.1 hypothetical protein BC749_10742 [Flavobacterium araucananum]